MRVGDALDLEGVARLVGRIEGLDEAAVVRHVVGAGRPARDPVVDDILSTAREAAVDGPGLLARLSRKSKCKAQVDA